MTTEEKARAYDEALKRARKAIVDCGDNEGRKRMIYSIHPELRESEDERIRQALCDIVRDMPYMETELRAHGLTVEKTIAWLEKQKYNRMQPIYDNQESFESALDKAWKSYNESGARTVDSCEDDYTECAHAKGFREGYLFGLEKQGEQKPAECITDSALQKIKRAITDCKNLSEHFKDTKENFYQYYGGKAEGLQLALTYFRNENEQPLEEYVPDSVKFEEGFKTGRELGFREGVESVKPAVWSEEDEKMVRFYEDDYNNNIGNMPMCDVIENRIKFKDWLLNRLKSLRPQPKRDCKDCAMFLNGECTKPHWKPSEEQMNALKNAIRISPPGENNDILISLFNDIRNLCR